MKKLTKDTYVACPEYSESFHGTIGELKETLQYIGEYEIYRIVDIVVMNKEPFMTVDDEWLIDLIQREVERQGCDNERSSESGGEIALVEELLINHIKSDYKAIMDKMPRLYYGESKEIRIDLNDF